MEDFSTTYEIPSIPAVVPPDMIENGVKYNKDVPRVCPLCKSDVRLFFINFNDKMLMCENTECEFPFGYEDLIFVKDDREHTDNTTAARTATCSVTESWIESDVTKPSKTNWDFPQNTLEQKALDAREYFNMKLPIKRIIKKDTCQTEEYRNLQELRRLGQKIESVSNPKPMIKNRKMIKELMSLPSRSKMPLVKPEEMEVIKDDIELNDFQVNIVNDGSSMIKIDLSIPGPAGPV